MPGSEIPDLQGVFRFVSRLHTMSKRGMRGALADCPRCHFGMLENLHILIEQRGVEGAIYVSEVARAMRQPMPAVSRGLRMMEQDGSIVRETDPNDRRKTFVRITPAGRAGTPAKRGGTERLLWPHHGTDDTGTDRSDVRPARCAVGCN